MAIRLELSESFHMIEDDHNKLTGGTPAEFSYFDRMVFNNATAIVSRRRRDLAGTKA